MMIYIVGDSPSQQNKYKHVPFVGTKSYRVLLDWIYNLDVDITYVETYNQSELKSQYIKYKWKDGKVLALGEKASTKLTELEVPHFKLPHPSGKNRKLNDKEYVDKVLKGCYEYIHGDGTDHIWQRPN